MCYCIDRIPPTSVPVAGTFCQTQCPGEQLGTSGSYVSQCGNTDVRFDTVSVYRKSELFRLLHLSHIKSITFTT